MRRLLGVSVEHPDSAVRRSRLGTSVVITAIVGSLLASIALGVVAFHWSSTADTADKRTATYENEAGRLRARQLAARSVTDALKLKAVQVINAFDNVDSAVDTVGPTQVNAARVAGDAIALYNQGDFPAARAKFSGDDAAAVADASAKTESANTALAATQKAIADLKAANGG